MKMKKYIKNQKEIDLICWNISNLEDKTPQQIQKLKKEVINWFNKNPEYDELPKEYQEYLKQL
jgi:hypothetical protein